MPNGEQQESQMPKTTEQTEELMEQMGRSVGQAVRRTQERVEEVAATITDKVGRIDLLKRIKKPSSVTKEGTDQQSEQHAAAAEGQSQGEGGPTMKRAEEAVNRLGGRLSTLTTRGNFMLQRVLARSREELEDIWAEAQSIRHRGNRSIT